MEYFNSTHGARKGLADTALKTANSGYLTRRLCDVAQDLTITKKKCDNPGSLNLSEIIEGGNVIVSLSERSLGRVSAKDIKNPITGEILIKKNQIAINVEDARTNRFIPGDRIDAAIAELNFDKRKISLSIKLLEEIQNKEAVSKFSSPLSGKNLPFSSLSEKLDNKKKEDK